MRSSTASSLLVLLLIAVIVWSLNLQKPDGRLHLYFLDVGQGDAIYGQLPSGEDFLIDAGRNDQVLSELGQVMPLGDREIDLVIATHADADHIGGMSDVLDRYSVKEIWINGAVHTTDTYFDLLKAIQTEKTVGAKVAVAKRGDVKSWGTISMTALSPIESFEGIKPDEQNDASIVTRLVYNNFSTLFTGDAEFVLEDKMINSTSLPLSSTVLKLGHHGSGGSTSEKFLQFVNPKAAIISVGKENRYGHPSKRVTDLLESKKISTYRTDQKGRIEIVSDGINFDVK